jgi:hypothetical protein
MRPKMDLDWRVNRASLATSKSPIWDALRTPGVWSPEILVNNNDHCDTQSHVVRH